MVKISISLLGLLVSSQLFLRQTGADSELGLLDNYLPASMQALAYYIDLLQYEPAYTTTLAPPLNQPANGHETTLVSTTSKPPIVASTPTSIWWKPTTTTSSTTNNQHTTTSWWKPPQWWTTTTNKPINNIFTTTTTVRPLTTPKHKPGLYAPLPQSQRTTKYPNWINKKPGNYAIKPTKTSSSSKLTDDKNLLEWLFQMKTKPINRYIDHNFNLLDSLPAGVLRDFLDEPLPAPRDDDQVNEFLRRYDDNFHSSFSKYYPVTGKKRVPPTKPYVEFILLYDLLKRDAKANEFSKYEGYSEEILIELNKLSKYPADRQLHALFSRLIERNEITRSDVVGRVKSIIKDLEDPSGPTTKALIYFPPLQFLL